MAATPRAPPPVEPNLHHFFSSLPGTGTGREDEWSQELPHKKACKKGKGQGGKQACTMETTKMGKESGQKRQKLAMGQKNARAPPKSSQHPKAHKNTPTPRPTPSQNTMRAKGWSAGMCIFGALPFSRQAVRGALIPCGLFLDGAKGGSSLAAITCATILHSMVTWKGRLGYQDVQWQPKIFFASECKRCW